MSSLQHSDPHSDYLETLKTDFFGDRVFVFTPVGDVIDLPRGATPIDFAYAIHSDIGDHTSGALVNRKMVSLDTPLENGDITEIITKKSAKPSKKWLEYAKTTLAARHIRSVLMRESEREAKERDR
jgi:GTP pyrophosphokinase